MSLLSWKPPFISPILFIPALIYHSIEKAQQYRINCLFVTRMRTTTLNHLVSRRVQVSLSVGPSAVAPYYTPYGGRGEHSYSAWRACGLPVAPSECARSRSRPGGIPCGDRPPRCQRSIYLQCLLEDECITVCL